MSQGTVKWFNTQKGYGFISQPDGDDVFVHHSEVKGGYLQDGDTVQFEMGQGQKGPCAVNVNLA